MQIPMEFILEEGVKKRIKFFKADVFQKFQKLLENLSEIELKTIKYAKVSFMNYI